MRAKIVIATICLMAAILCVWCHAASVQLAWDAPETNIDGTPLQDLAGYRLYHGVASGVYLDRVDVTNTFFRTNVVISTNTTVSPPLISSSTVVRIMPVETVTYTNLQHGCSNFFVVTAFNMYGCESAFSDEVVLFVKESKPSSVTEVAVPPLDFR